MKNRCHSTPGLAGCNLARLTARCSCELNFVKTEVEKRHKWNKLKIENQKMSISNREISENVYGFHF